MRICIDLQLALSAMFQIYRSRLNSPSASHHSLASVAALPTNATTFDAKKAAVHISRSNRQSTATNCDCRRKRVHNTYAENACFKPSQ
jgi:hypothetical protein